MTALCKISKIWPQYLYALIIYSYSEQDADQQDCMNNKKKGKEKDAHALQILIC